MLWLVNMDLMRKSMSTISMYCSWSTLSWIAIFWITDDYEAAVATKSWNKLKRILNPLLIWSDQNLAQIGDSWRVQGPHDRGDWGAWANAGTLSLNEFCTCPIRHSKIAFLVYLCYAYKNTKIKIGWQTILFRLFVVSSWPSATEQQQRMQMAM